MAFSFSARSASAPFARDCVAFSSMSSLRNEIGGTLDLGGEDKGAVASAADLRRGTLGLRETSVELGEAEGEGLVAVVFLDAPKDMTRERKVVIWWKA